TSPTCTPCERSSRCSASLHPHSANLLAEYAPEFPRATRPAVLATLTIALGAERRSARSRSCRRATSTSRASGSRARRRAVASPMPLEAPVTRAIIAAHRMEVRPGSCSRALEDARGCRAGRDPELLVDARYMSIDRPHAQIQLGRDVAIRPSGGDELEHLDLAIRED